MTILGKIMAIFVLLLSILQGALTVMLFATHTNWVNQTSKWENQAKVANASIQQYQADYENAVKDGKDRVAAAEAKSNLYAANAQAQSVLRADAEKKLLEKENEVAKQTSIAKTAQTAAQLRQAEFDQQLNVVKQRDAQIATLVTDNKREREDRVNAEIAMKTALIQSQRLEEQLKGVMKELAKNGNAGAGTTTSAKPNINAPNPPSENVNGLVAAVDVGGLVKLTIGSDAGLRVNHTLEAFRIAPNPQYLGTLRVRTVTANEAVAEPIGQMLAPLQPGDRVASRIVAN